MMQNVDVVRILYWRYRDVRNGLTVQPEPPGEPRRLDQCPVAAERAALKSLWIDRLPASQWQRTARYLDDYAAWIGNNGLKATIAVLLDVPPANDHRCAGDSEMRAEIIARMRQEVTGRGLNFYDFETEVAGVARNRGSDLHIYGFGRRATGHLNYAGHEVYASVIVDLLVGDPTVSPSRPRQ